MRIKLLLIILLILPISAAFALKATIDPTELAVGGRSLAMGRAFIAIADDATAVFQNPAGLAQLKTWQFTSMSVNLLSDVQYNQLAATYPLSTEAIGIGYVGASVGGSILTTRNPVTNRIVPTGQGAIGYNTMVLLFSGATSRFYKNLKLGFSLKAFSQSLIGVPAGDATALGQDLDLGAIYSPNSWFSLGAAGSNILPYAAGGKLMWSSGISESIPAAVKIGWATKLLGPGALKEYRTHRLGISHDIEFFPSKSARPMLNHVGLEWLPWENVIFRLGLDQDYAARGDGTMGITNNFGVGVGVSFLGVRLDYTFHSFYDLPENNSHFFSLSFAAPEKKPAIIPLASKEAYLKIDSPENNFTTFDPWAILNGLLLSKKQLKEIKANNIPVTIDANNKLWAAIPLMSYGRNTLQVDAVNLNGRIMETHKINVVKLMNFSDIPKTHPDRQLLGYFGALYYIVPDKDKKFYPKRQMTKGRLSLLFNRIKPSTTPITLVKYLSRAEAIAMIVKFDGKKEPKYIYEKPYADVPVKYWAAKAIDIAKREGLLDVYQGKRLDPNRKITRLEIVKILAKTQIVKQKIAELYPSEVNGAFENP